MNYASATFTIENQQDRLERHLLESALVDCEQLTLAKKIQSRQEGPLLMILLQLSFIDLHQFSSLLDWTVYTKFDGC
jgi:Protein of unknown function (DUF2949)